MIQMILHRTKTQVCSLRFVFALTAYLVMVLLTVCTVGSGAGEESPETLLTMILHRNSARWLSSDSYVWIRIWDRAITGNYHTVVLAVLAPAVCVVPLTDELGTQNYRFTVSRTGTRHWLLSYWCSAYLTACCFILTGILCIAAVCAVCFPGASAPFLRAGSPGELGTFSGMMQFALNRSIFLLQYAPWVSCLCLTVGAWFENPFAAICLPLVALFLGKEFAAGKFSQHPEQTVWLMFDTDKLIRPQRWFPQLANGTSAYWLLAVFGILNLVSLLLFCRIAKRRILQ